MNEFPSRFDHVAEEPKIYQQWLAANAFAPDMSSDAESRCILMPPPNANGALHVGHAYEVAIQDTMIRYWRMRGYKTLWQPGMDHAGFETQVVFDRKLAKEGRNRGSMTREEQYREIFAFCKSFEPVVRGQLERLGASADWSRFCFMLDEPLVATVYQTFKKLYDDDLLYRAKRPVHWCVKDQTTLSDLEVKDEARTSPLYYVRYGPLTIATVRPESQAADVALAVNPSDDRYTSYIGKTLDVELADRTVQLPVIADDFVKPEFGTGVVKVSPGVDPNDYDMAQRHNLPVIEIVDQYGKLNDKAGAYAGLKVLEARIKIVEAMQAKGLLEKIDETYTNSVKVCYKCGNLIEPRLVDQWWLALTKPTKNGKSLRDMAVESVKSGETTFVTERFKNQFFSWMEQLRDWPLSRQIAWGIQLPVWYDAEGNAVVTDGSEPDNAAELTRDPDVFDTWFSSCQWPYSTLGNHNNDLATFYPTSVIMPGYDILFFWVARMMMLSIYAQGETPYKVINLHGMVRDKDRQKMSKSKGNVIDPLGVVEEYGADALRLALLYGFAPGTDPTLSDEKIKGMRNFRTKMWNIARFVDMNTDTSTKPECVPVTDADHQIMKQLAAATRTITEHLDQFDMHLALEALYRFVWGDFADVYIEKAKVQLQDPAQKATTQGNLRCVMDEILKLSHPFMPFVTEAIFARFYPDAAGTLIGARWPEGQA